MLRSRQRGSRECLSASEQRGKGSAPRCDVSGFSARNRGWPALALDRHRDKYGRYQRRKGTELRVNRVALTVRRTLPVFLCEQTSATPVSMSQKCQQRKRPSPSWDIGDGISSGGRLVTKARPSVRGSSPLSRSNGYCPLAYCKRQGLMCDVSHSRPHGDEFRLLP
jgi:hypothetical protein